MKAKIEIDLSTNAFGVWGVSNELSRILQNLADKIRADGTNDMEQITLCDFDMKVVGHFHIEN